MSQRADLRENAIITVSSFYCSVEGCADPELPDGAWIMRDAHEAVVGCSNSPNHVTWLLTCTHEGQWVGPYVTCSSSGPVAVSPQQVPVVGVRNTVSTPSLSRPVLQSNHQGRNLKYSMCMILH